MLPNCLIVRATTTCSGSLRWRSIASVIRLFAWCGMNTSRSSGARPPASRTFLVASVMKPLAHLKTERPSIAR